MVLVAIIGSFTVLLSGATIGSAPELLARATAVYHAAVSERVRLFLGPLLNFRLWLLAGLIFLVERRFRADRRQPILSTGLAQDFVWFLSFSVTHLLFLNAYGRFLRGVYEQHLSFLTLNSVAHWRLPVRIVVSLLVIDFLWWFRHYIRHKVTILWYFHAVHHSQRELNFLTNLRIHFVESLFDGTVTFFPLLMLQIELPTAFYIAAAVQGNLFLQHANIRSGFGPLKYFLVTPQVHRIHHSIEPRHRDLNFGSLFTIWDRVFGTLHQDYDEYPQTGIPDPAFPLEQNRPGMFGIVRTYVAQTLYPFRQMAEYLRDRLGRSTA